MNKNIASLAIGIATSLSTVFAQETNAQEMPFQNENNKQSLEEKHNEEKPFFSIVKYTHGLYRTIYDIAENGTFKTNNVTDIVNYKSLAQFEHDLNNMVYDNELNTKNVHTKPADYIEMKILNVLKERIDSLNIPELTDSFYKLYANSRRDGIPSFKETVLSMAIGGASIKSNLENNQTVELFNETYNSDVVNNVALYLKELGETYNLDNQTLQNISILEHYTNFCMQNGYSIEQMMLEKPSSINPWDLPDPVGN